MARYAGKSSGLRASSGEDEFETGEFKELNPANTFMIKVEQRPALVAIRFRLHDVTTTVRPVVYFKKVNPRFLSIENHRDALSLYLGINHGDVITYIGISHKRF